MLIIVLVTAVKTCKVPAISLSSLSSKFTLLCLLLCTAAESYKHFFCQLADIHFISRGYCRAIIARKYSLPGSSPPYRFQTLQSQQEFELHPQAISPFLQPLEISFNLSVPTSNGGHFQRHTLVHPCQSEKAGDSCRPLLIHPHPLAMMSCFNRSVPACALSQVSLLLQAAFGSSSLFEEV